MDCCHTLEPKVQLLETPYAFLGEEAPECTDVTDVVIGEATKGFSLDPRVYQTSTEFVCLEVLVCDEGNCFYNRQLQPHNPRRCCDHSELWL